MDDLELLLVALGKPQYPCIITRFEDNKSHYCSVINLQLQSVNFVSIDDSTIKYSCINLLNNQFITYHHGSIPFRWLETKIQRTKTMRGHCQVYLKK